MKLSRILNTSIFKTIRFNLHYFGLKAFFKPKILIAKNVKLVSLKGKIIINDSFKRGKIGFSNEQPEPSKRKNSYYFNYGGVLEIKGTTFEICKGTSIVVKKNANLTLGENFYLGPSSCISCEKEIEIGDNVMIGWETLIMDNDGHKIYSNETNELINSPKKICIHDKVWVGCRCLILKGAQITKGTIIAACGIVNKELTQTFSIYVNNKVVRENVTFEI